jgi:CRP/FNR family cyclic AMP-dependent transcriptional regulator
MVASSIKPSVSILKDIKLLKSFSDQELQQLIQSGSAASYEAHSNVVIEGELSWGLYILLDGMVGIFKTNKLTGTSYDVGQLRAGSFFGEMSLIDDNPRSATVKTVTPCELFYISKDSFTEFLNRSPDLRLRFYTNCVTNLVVRLRELDDNYVISQYQLWQVALKKEGKAE